MVFDPKYVRYDIIASLTTVPCSYEELLKRFDNHTNGYLDMALQSVLTALQKEGKIRQNKKGIYKSTAAGRKYVDDTGEYDV